MKLRQLLRRLQNSERHHNKIYFALFILLFFILFLPVFFQVRFEFLKPFGIIGVFLINVLGSATIFVPTPALLATGAIGTQHNIIFVSLIGALGASLGECTTFLFGYTSNKILDLEKHRILKKFKEKIFEKWGTATILFFAFVPNPLFDGIGMIAGVSKYPIKKFLILTFIGRFIRFMVVLFIFKYLVWPLHWP